MNRARTQAFRHGQLAGVRAIAFALALAGFAANSAWGEDEMADVLGDLGEATTLDAEAEDKAARARQLEDAGIVLGQVFDGERGVPVAAVTVILSWPVTDDAGRPRQEVRITDADGAFEFPPVPAGLYSVSFVKAGYRASSMTDFEVQAAQVNRADFPLPPLPTDTAGGVLELDAFTVEASTVDDMLGSLELRMDSDVQLNIMSAEELSKFAAADVAEALRRVAGVNIVEGRFAIIRGLEDRYTSTLYNSAPVPSPDPDRQSVQLDLFTSEVVGNLLIAKTFAPEHPSNSSAGSIDIITYDYPEKFTSQLKAAGGINGNAQDRFLEFADDSATSVEWDAFGPVDAEFGGLLGGRGELAQREIRYKAVVNWERNFQTAEGFQEGLEPRSARRRLTNITRSGDLSLGQLNLSSGRFDLTTSGVEKQGTGYLALGIDLDRAGNHSLDASAFYTRKQEEVVQLKENGFLPNYDYGPLVEEQRDDDFFEVQWGDFEGFATPISWIAGLGALRETAPEGASRGPLWFTNFTESRTFERDRELLVTQLNGDHAIAAVEGLHFDWAANWARTQQDETSRQVRYYFEPCGFANVNPVSCPEGVARIDIPGQFPVTLDALGPGLFFANDGILFSSNDIEEEQFFARLDGDYERAINDWLAFEVRSGIWYEQSDRDVLSRFLESPTVEGASQFAIFAETPEALGLEIFDPQRGLDRTPDGDISGLRDGANESTREIGAVNVGAKAILWEKLDLLGGVRLESIFIESLNDVFTGELSFGAPQTFPPAYLFFDRLDNPNPDRVPGSLDDTSEISARDRRDLDRQGASFNDELLGIEVPLGPCRDPRFPDAQCVDLVTEGQISDLLNGEIDERRVLPAVGFAYRPVEGLTLRGAYSQTTARPSFRELGFYVSVEPGSDDRIVGNPQLGLSDVESFDARAEYVWGNLGELFAVSGFYKTIDDPIESIVLRNPLNAEESTSALWRTFFNNPSQAKLWGVEFEARKSLGFAGPDFLDHLSVGGNFTYIDAEVDRNPIELVRAEPFFGVAEGDQELFSQLESSRRLFGQPEWIVNADLSFDHPGWGTRATLAFFAISDVLDAAGSAFLGGNDSITLDRYVDSYHTLDLILSQTLPLDRLRGDLAIKFSAKNLTDSTRRLVYDPAQTDGRFTERAFKVGRDFKLTLTYTFF